MALQAVVDGVTITVDCASEMVNFLALYKKSQVPEVEVPAPTRAQLLELGVAQPEPPDSPRARRNKAALAAIGATGARRASRARAARSQRVQPTAPNPVEQFVARMTGRIKNARRPESEMQVMEGQVWKAAFGGSQREVMVKSIRPDDTVEIEVLVAGNKTGRSSEKPMTLKTLVTRYRLQ
jgi:hypothetical protein